MKYFLLFALRFALRLIVCNPNVCYGLSLPSAPVPASASHSVKRGRSAGECLFGDFTEKLLLCALLQCGVITSPSVGNFGAADPKCSKNVTVCTSAETMN